MQLLPKPQKHNQRPYSLELESSFEQSPSIAPCLKNSLHNHSLNDPALNDNPLYQSPLQSQPNELHQRVVILIDGSNLFYAASYLGIEIDYVKLLRYMTQNRRLIRAYFYTGVDRTNEKQQGFLLWMRRNGYRVVTKELVQFADGSRKANLDVEIAVDMMTLAKHCDTVVLLSGDGDLAYAVNAVAYQGTRIEVMSLRSMTNDALFNIADHYIDLEAIKHEIQR